MEKLQPEDLDEEARLLSNQEMDLVNMRAQILKQKMALDDHIRSLHRDAQWIERNKKSLRHRRGELDELQQQLKHREERLTEKEQDLAERQKLTPYYIPYPGGSPPPVASTPTPAPTAGTTPPATSDNQPPTSLAQTRPSSRSPSDDIITSGNDVDPIRDMDEGGPDDTAFLSLLHTIQQYADSRDDNFDWKDKRYE